MLAPALATMLWCSPPTRSRPLPIWTAALRGRSADLRPARYRRLHVHQRHRAGAGQRRVGVTARRRPSWPAASRPPAPTSPRQLRRDAEGATKARSRIEVVPGASSEAMRCWSAAPSPGTTCSSARCRRGPELGPRAGRDGYHQRGFEPDRLDVAINGVRVCIDGTGGAAATGRSHRAGVHDHGRISRRARPPPRLDRPTCPSLRRRELGVLAREDHPDAAHHRPRRPPGARPGGHPGRRPALVGPLPAGRSSSSSTAATR